MSQEQADFLVGLKKTLWYIASSISVAIIMSMTAFYFNTNNKLEYLESENKQLKTQIEQVYTKETMDIKINHISNEVGDIKKGIKDINRKLDEMN